MVRFASIELNNFKNVEYGKVRMPSFIAKEPDDKADIVGIYGQNGSGKTTITDALILLKAVMSGTPLSHNTTDYITQGMDFATIKTEFTTDENTLVSYSITLNKADGHITDEKISVFSISPKKRTDGIEWKADSADFLPKKRFSVYSNSLSKKVDMEVEKRLCINEHRSVLFSDRISELMAGDELISNVIVPIKEFAQKRLFIIKSEHNISPEHIDFVTNTDFLSYSISLRVPTVMTVPVFESFAGVLKNINVIMSAIIPNLSVRIHALGKEITADGKEGMRFELMSGRGDVAVPIRYESEGIKKILSLVNLLIAMYNNPSMLIAVDEMDAGIFEFLLGELLSCIEESGKGQLIFTSHNLRPLEMIQSEDIVFTTTNPKNRYIRIKEKGNLRKSYIRHITLGGLEETIYEPTNTFEIASAFRKCSKQ